MPTRCVLASDLSDDNQQLLSSAKAAFQQQFSREPTHAACAPGRVNLIGEHTDYNDGFVLPMALPHITLVAGRVNDTSEIRVLTLAGGVDKPTYTSMDVPSDKATLTPGTPSWANYIKGVIAHYPGKIAGFDMVVTTSVPLGGGLSSSAALEVSTFTLLESMFPVEVSHKDKALICQKAEHTFAGMPCGIMDQFISTMGEKGCALLIDCMSMEAKKVKLELYGKSILVINSNVKHQLTGSEYPERRESCAKAAAALGVKSLRHADMEMLSKNSSDMNELMHRRARHVITEISRTKEAVLALEKGDMKRFGELMVASHNSLRDDFEVSCPELDQLVEIAMAIPGVYGSRMTGGGFGGCTVTLCDCQAVSDVIDQVKKKYSGEPITFECSAGDGSCIIKF